MDWHMGAVLPGLYVGNYRDSKDHQQLDKFQITHIIAIHDSPRRLLPDKHYLCVMAADTPDQNLSQYFSVCNDFIHAARLREGNVLIHCLAGMSRSVTVAVAYIMTATNLNWKEALKVVRAGRAVANPNIGFQTQLQDFEMYRLSEERRRLRERYPSLALETMDRSKCLTALDNYEELLQNRDICEGNCTRGEKCPTGVCNMDPTKGLFRRRPSTASTRSRLRPQASTSASVNNLGGSVAAAAGSATAAGSAQSCPTSPSRTALTRRSVGEQRIPEDEEAHHSPTTSSEAAAYASAVNAAKMDQQLQHQQQLLQQQTQQQLQQPQHQMQQQQHRQAQKQKQMQQPQQQQLQQPQPQMQQPIQQSQPQQQRQQQPTQQSQQQQHNQSQQQTRQLQKKSPTVARQGSTRGVSSAGARLTSATAAEAATVGERDKQQTQTQTQQQQQQQQEQQPQRTSHNANGSGLQRSASTVSGLAVRPRSSPAGLHSYTAGSVPSSVHGSRVDLRDTDKGSAIYLGCSAPRNSTLSLSSRGSSGPPSPTCTPPASPRHGIRRSASLVKKTR